MLRNVGPEIRLSTPIAFANEAQPALGTTLRECATPGLHDEAFACLTRLFPGGGSPVLDLGAGTGAWSDRLLHGGFREVTAFDQNALQFHGTASFVSGDLDMDFADRLGNQKFRLITALEVIEHLESPAHFLRQCASLLHPTGTLVLTTPNIESMPSRIKLLAQGRIRHFDGNGDRTHITPIDAFLLERIAARAGLRVTDRFPLVRFWYDRRLGFRLLAAALAPFVGGSPYGACHLFVLRPSAS